MQPAAATNPLNDKIISDLENLLRNEFCITTSKDTLNKYIADISKIYTPANLQLYDNKLQETAKKIHDDLKNTVHNLAATIAYNNIKKLIENDKSNATQKESLMLTLNNPIYANLLQKLMTRKHATHNSFAMTVLYDLIHLGDLDKKLKDLRKDLRIDTRTLAPKINVLLTIGFINYDIYILDILSSSCDKLKTILPNLNILFSQSAVSDTYIDSYLSKAIATSNQLILHAYRRRFLRDLYQEFLYQIDRIMAEKYSYSIESIPSLVAVEPQEFAFTEEEREFGYYIHYQQNAAKYYYQNLRRLLSDKSPALLSRADLKLCLVIDRNLEFQNTKGVAYITPAQINAALTLQTEQVCEKFNPILKSNNLNQLRHSITEIALAHNIIIKREILTEDLQLIQALFTASTWDILMIDPVNSDLTLTGREFTFVDAIKACADQSSWNNFLSKLLHEHRLSNHLLKLILTTNKNLIQTDQIINANRNTALTQSQSVDTYKLMQFLRSQNSIYSGASSVNNQIKYRTTFGMQIFNIHTMSPPIVKTRLQILIEAGCSLNDHNTISNTALHTFIVYEREDLVDVLLDFNETLPKEKQLNPNIQNTALNSMIADGRTPLHLAVQTFASLKIIKRLLNISANPNIQDELGATPLHYAFLLGRADIIVQLIQSGAKLDLKDKQGYLPFDYLDNKNIAKLYAEFGVSSTQDAIKKSGYLTSMKYEARCIGARQNYLLSNPEGHQYFWAEPTTGQAGDMDKKLMFPTIRDRYFENNATDKPILTELKNKMTKDECSDTQQSFVMKQIADLDEEILLDFIISERERLLELYSAENNDTSRLLTILNQEFIIYEQIHSQLSKIKDGDNISIDINLNNLLQINLLRKNGKYNLKIKILNKDEIKLQNCVDLESHYAVTGGHYVFDELHISQINRVVSVILTSKIRSIPCSVHRNVNSQTNILNTPTIVSAMNTNNPQPPHSASIQQTTEELQKYIHKPNVSAVANQNSATIPLSHESGLTTVTSSGTNDPFINHLSAALSKINLGEGSRAISYGKEDYFYGINPEDRELWHELINIGDDKSVQAVLAANKYYLLTHVIGNPHSPLVSLLRQSACAYGNIALHSMMINTHDQSVIKLFTPNAEQVKLLKSVCSGADYLLRYYEIKQKNAQTAAKDIKEAKTAEINKAISWQDLQGKTPLLLACKNVNQSYAMRLIALDSQNLTLNTADNIELRTPLHIACILGLREVAKKLIDLNAEQCADKFGHKPLDYLNCSPKAKMENIRNVLLSVNFFAGRYFDDRHVDQVCAELLKQNDLLQDEINKLIPNIAQLAHVASKISQRK